MSAAGKDTLALLRYYSLKHKTPAIEFDAFLPFVERYIARYRNERPGLEELASDTVNELTLQLDELSQTQACSVSYENGRIKTITFPHYYADMVLEAYRSLEDNPEHPFPSRDLLPADIPDDLVRTINIQTEFMQIIEEPEQFRGRILRLVFPDQIREMIITAELAKRKLIELCIVKVRLYLNTQRNADYIRHKLLVVFQRRDLILKETLDTVIEKPAKAAAEFLDPSEFSYAFWAHFTNFIIQEFRQKEAKLTEENMFCQAAYLLGFYNTFLKGKVQKEREEDSALKLLLTGLKSPPYVFSTADVIGMKDRSGLRIARRTTPERIHAFIELRMVPEKEHALPELIRLRSADNGLYFIHRDVLFQYILKQLPDVKAELREQYLTEWSDHFRQYRRVLPMTEDRAFQKDLEQRLRVVQPYLAGLLDYDLLSVARREVQSTPELSALIGGLYSESKSALKPLSDILGLQRKELFDAAKLRLSFWELLPDFKKLLTFFSRIFASGGNGKVKEPAPAKREKSGSATRSAAASGSTGRPKTTSMAVRDADDEGERGHSEKAQTAMYNAALQKLRDALLDGVTVERKLQDLAEKWNPLYDEGAKRNLVEDTNSLIRDYFRPLKRGFRVRPPDLARIRNLAETLSENKAFDRIRRKDLFLEYIQVYMLKLLGEK